MRKAILILALLVFAGSMIFAMPGQETTTNTVRWSFWGGESRIRNYQLTNDIFLTETGITIAGEPAPGTDQHFNKFLTTFRGGGAADIVQLGGYFSNLGIQDNGRSAPDLRDILLPLDQFVRSGVLNTSNIDKAALDAGTRDGVLYAISAGTNMPSLVYNKSMLERAGAPLPKVDMTWAEFDTWLRAVQARLPAGTYAMTDNGATTTGSVFFGYWAGDNGTPMWDGARTHLTAAIVQRYFDMWAGWRTAGVIPPAATAADFAETNEATSSLVAGRTALSFIWSNQLNGYQGAMQDELDLIMLPNAAVSKGLWAQMSQMMGININSKNAENAAKYINFRVNDPRVWSIMGADPGVPVTPATRAAVAANATPVTRKIVSYLDVAGKNASPPNPNMPNDTEWNSGLFLIYQNAAYGRVTNAQAAQQVMDLINRLTR
ncbi:MAG: ABC transporter substrate-binding protein [Treponema sp.]|jgi:multiple sugar transport system substrate-binding protein|nr:ABC transporter substrate-binding protein [Treponema sp.]